MKSTDTKENTVLTWICVLLCVILTVILILNVVVILKRYREQEASLNLFGHFPVIILSDELQPVAEDGGLAIFVSVDPNELEQGDLIVYRNKTNGMSISIDFVENVEAGVIELSPKEGEQDRLIAVDQVIGICKANIPVLGWMMDFLTRLPVRIAVAAIIVILFVESYFYMSKRDRSDSSQTSGSDVSEI